MSGWIPFIIGMIAITYLKVLRKPVKKGRMPGRPLDPLYKTELEHHFEYYQKLSDENKVRFEKRVQAFIDNNQFIPRSYTHVNAEMKALISASAIQLTFGFEHLNFDHFNKILIYQDDYYSRITRKYHQGEVNMHGIIVLSWQNFLEGYETSNDGRNLGLHEMAHALRLENGIYNGEFDFLEEEDIREFDRLAKLEAEKIRNGHKSLFRSYASANPHEFFAVAVENFFEKPQEFKDYNYPLYFALAKLLKQDPLKLFHSVERVNY